MNKQKTKGKAKAKKTTKKPIRAPVKKKMPKRTPKMDPETFALAYAMIKIKEPQAGVRRIGKLLHLSPTTVQSYITNPDYIKFIDTKLIQKLSDGKREKDIIYANKIMKAAFDLNAKRIKDLTTPKVIIKKGKRIEIPPTEKDWEEARIISLQMLSIARTEAEIKRALTTIQLNIDARQQTVNITECNKCMDGFVEEVLPCLCKKCKEKVVGVVMASKPVELVV